MPDPRDDLPGFVAGELSAAEAEALAEALAGDEVLRADLDAVRVAAGALADTAALELPGLGELPALALPAGTEVATVLLVATDDGSDPAYAGARLAAFELARRRRAPARVVLYDRSPELYLVDPYARGGGAAGLLDEAAAERLGRPYLAGQLRAAGAAGLEAGAWVPAAAGALAECLAAVAADDLMLPAKLASPGLVDRVRGHTLGAFTAALRGRPARVHLADERGRLVAL